MEATMFMHHYDIRRRTDGSIDTDFSRQRGLMERRAVMTDFVMGLRKAGKFLVAAAVAIGVVALSMVPVNEGASWSAPTASRTGQHGINLIYPMSAAHLYAIRSRADFASHAVR
jgi:hypothetical protein